MNKKKILEILDKHADKNYGEIYIEQHQEIAKDLLKDLKKQLTLTEVSQQRELLLAYEEYTSYKVLGKKTNRISKQMVEDFLANNCG